MKEKIDALRSKVEQARCWFDCKNMEYGVKWANTAMEIVDGFEGKEEDEVALFVGIIEIMLEGYEEVFGMPLEDGKEV